MATKNDLDSWALALDQYGYNSKTESIWDKMPYDKRQDIAPQISDYMRNAPKPPTANVPPPKPVSLDSWPSKNYRVLTVDEAIVFHRLGVTVYKLPRKVEAAKNCLYKPLDKAFGDGSISDKMSDQMLKRLWTIGDNYDYAIEEE